MTADARERLLAGYQAWNRGDLEEWLEFMHPDVRLDSPGVFPGFDREYRGRDGLRRFWDQLHDPWENFAIDIEAIAEEPNGFVVAIRFRAKGAGSGVDVDMHFGHAFRLEGDRVIEIIARATAEEARDTLRARAD
jgi:ketosteroid isomerase-like protein